jgi:Wiskott-Aldrich syndrome protein
MDAGAHKLVETVVLKTLHAQSFTRSSSQASLVLSDLLSRYITLLATTCSKYAQHAGRLNMTVRDAMYALDELGVSMDELHEYCGTEGDELARYSGHSAKRQEDLCEFKGQSERDNRIFCINAPAPRAQRR